MLCSYTVATFVSQFLFINFVRKCSLDVRMQVHHVTIGLVTQFPWAIIMF
jgi:hypothetical protein